MNNSYIILCSLWLGAGVLALTKDKITKLDYFVVWIVLVVQLLCMALGV